MACLLALVALISPRLAIVALWLFSDLLSRAFDSWILPVLGFFLLPWTTLTYVAFGEGGAGQPVTGAEWVAIGVAVLLDIGSWGSNR